MARLTGTVFDSVAGRMALLRQRESALRSTLAALDTDRKARAISMQTGDPAQRAGADLLWQHWIDKRRSALNAEMARTFVQIETIRAELARAHGRHEVTQRLARQALDADRAAREAKWERGW